MVGPATRSVATSKGAKLQAPRHDAEQVAGVRATGFAGFLCGFEAVVSLELFAELFAEPDVGVTSMKGLSLARIGMDEGCFIAVVVANRYWSDE